MSKTVTVYKDFNSKKPYYVTVDDVLDRIRTSTIKNQIEALRSETDNKKKRALKNKLPCICFSGKFTERKDKAITEHSGFVILDFDKLDNVESLKSEMKLYDFVYAAFVSPSGDGLKVLVRIPPITEKHRGYYAGLLKMFPNLDSTSKNESRICYESIDPDIYINKNATEFTDYVEEKKIEKSTVEPIVAERNNYAQAQVAIDMIRNAVDGEKHDTLIRASRLMGGFIAGGQITESEGIRLLENEILGRDIDDEQGALKDIRDGVNHGKNNPLAIEEKVEISKPKPSIDTEKANFFATKKEMAPDLKKWRNGTFELGLTTGMPSLDKYFLFKKGNFNIFNGKDNVGKSTVLWWLLMLSSLYHDWRWIILSIENRNSTVKKRLIEFYWCEKIEDMNEVKYKKASDFVDKHFLIVKNEKLYNYKDIIGIHQQASKTKKINGILIDPYNGLSIDLSDNSKLSTHEYHYECASEMQIYAKQEETCLYLNSHVTTFAARAEKAPNKADVEGGAKWANKADDFGTIHRETQDPQRWMLTELHIRKIKELETGGGYTPFDAPYILKMVNGSGFEDEYGYNPVLEFHKNKYSKNNLPTLDADEWIKEKEAEERGLNSVQHPDTFISTLTPDDDPESPF